MVRSHLRLLRLEGAVQCSGAADGDAISCCYCEASLLLQQEDTPTPIPLHSTATSKTSHVNVILKTPKRELRLNTLKGYG